MPPRKPKSGAAGRAKRKQITQAAELNLDTAGASDALAAALRRVSTAAIGMRKKRTPRSGQHTVCGYTIRRRRVKNTTTLHFSHKVCARVVGYSSVHTLAAAEIAREQAGRTIGELTPAGIELRIYGAMPIDGSRPPSLRHGRPDASVAAAARGLAAPAAALHAIAACGEPAATVVVVEHEAGKGPRDQSDLRKRMSNCEVGGAEWRRRDPVGKYEWVCRPGKRRRLPSLAFSLRPCLYTTLLSPLTRCLLRAYGGETARDCLHPDRKRHRSRRREPPGRQGLGFPPAVWRQFGRAARNYPVGARGQARHRSWHSRGEAKQVLHAPGGARRDRTQPQDCGKGRPPPPRAPPPVVTDTCAAPCLTLGPCAPHRARSTSSGLSTSWVWPTPMSSWMVSPASRPLSHRGARKGGPKTHFGLGWRCCLSPSRHGSSRRMCRASGSVCRALRAA